MNSKYTNTVPFKLHTSSIFSTQIQFFTYRLDNKHNIIVNTKNKPSKQISLSMVGYSIKLLPPSKALFFSVMIGHIYNLKTNKEFERLNEIRKSRE